MGVTDFRSTVGVTSLGQAEVERLAGAVDKVSASLDKLSTKSDQVKTPKWDSFAASVKDAIQNPLDAASSAAESFLKSIGPVGAGISVAAAGFTAFTAAGFSAAKQLGEYGDAISDTAIRLGMSTKETAQYSFAMKRAGGDISSVEAAMRALSRGLASSDEEGKKARNALEDIGIKARDAHGNLMPMAQLLPLISDKLQGMSDVADRNAAAIALFGRAGLELLPDLLELNEGLKRAKELGLGPSADDVKRWQEYQKQVAEVEMLWARLKRGMMEPIAGIVNVMLRFVPQGGSKEPYGAPVAGRMGQRYWTPDIYGGMRDELQGAGAFIDLEGNLRSRMPGAATAGALNAPWDLYAAQGRGKAAQDRIRASWGASKEGIEEALKAAKDDLQTARAEVLAEGLTDAEVTQRKAKADALAAQVAGLEERLNNLKDGVLKISSDVIFKANELAGPRMVPSLYGRRGAGMGWSDSLVVQSKDIADANKELDAARQSQTKAYNEGMLASGKTARERAAEYAKQELEHRIRIAELTAGPGGEVAAVEKIYQMRLAAAKTQEEAQRAENEHEERILELRNRERQQYRSMAESGFDALLSGGRGGFRSLALSQVAGIGRTIVGNAAENSFDWLRQNMPHINSPLLRGLPFGPDPLQQATTANTMATIENTTALMANARALAIAPSGGGGGFVSAVKAAAGYGSGLVDEDSELVSIYDAGFSGQWKQGPFYTAGGRSSVAGGLFDWGTTGKEKAVSGVATAGVLAGGALGIYSGIKQGGARGALTAIGSAAGAAAALDPEPISKAILGGIALGSGLVTMLFGDPKAKRAKDLEEGAQSRAFNEPAGTSYSADIYGRTFDYNYQGGMRPIVIYDQRQYNALDAKSFVDWGKDNPAAIAEVNTHAISSGNAEDFLGTIRQGMAV